MYYITSEVNNVIGRKTCQNSQNDSGISLEDVNEFFFELLLLQWPSAC